MSVAVYFIVQVILYASIPFYLAWLQRPLRVSAFYVYIGILLLLSGFLGAIYSLPIAPGINISGNNLAYGALLMSTVVLVITERDVSSVRYTIQLVLSITLFEVLLFTLLTIMLNDDAVLRPSSITSIIFSFSMPVIVLGGALLIAELLLLIFVFEQIKLRVSNVTVVSVLYTLCYVAVLCLDGLLFPMLAFAFAPGLGSVVVGHVVGKLVMGICYSLPMLIFLLTYRHTVTEFVEQPLTLGDMLQAPKARLVEEIERQRQSLALGEEQLRTYAQRLALATEAAGLGIWEYDVVNDRLIWDERSSHMFGLAPTGMTPTFATWAERIHPDDLSATLRAYEAALANIADYHVQFRVVWPDGQHRHLEVHGVVQRGEDGTPLRMIGVNADITLRKLLAQENELLTNQFYQAQRLESIGRLAGGIAHDFNNLLVPITSYAELGQRKSEADSAVYTYFRRIKEAADRAARLTSQILAFGRKQSMEMKVIDLNAIVTDFQQMLQRFLGEMIELKLELTDEPCNILADAGQIEQVLMNLAVNAHDAMPNGGTFTVATSKIRIDAEQADIHEGILMGEYLLLTVSDTGMGMDEVTKQRVFEPFFTTKPQGKGSGLGLSTVFGIIKQHHGKIEFSSEKEYGTTFCIFLPAHASPTAQLDAAAVDE